MHDETQIYLVFKDEIVHFNSLFDGGIKIVSVGPSSPEPVYNFEEFEGTNGKRLSNLSYTGFPFALSFRLKTESHYDWHLVATELRSLLYRDEPYYIITTREPGKQYRVLPAPWDLHRFMMTAGVYTVEFDVFEGHSESIETSLSQFSETDSWQFSQGLVTEDYEYTHTANKHVIFNAGDFPVDPRESYLKIKIEGMSDGNLTIFNKRTGERFIYRGTLHSNRGEVLTLDRVYPLKNGVHCGLDTNHGLITLLPGENQIEVSNVSRLKISWDFRFLYK